MGLPEAHELLSICYSLASRGEVMDAWLSLEKAKNMLLKELDGGDSSSNAHGTIGDLLKKIEEERERCQAFAEGNLLAVLGLGLAGTLTDKKVKKAYKKLALRFHPDKNVGVDSAPLFTLIRLAFETLSNSGQRSCYRPKQGTDKFIYHTKQKGNPFQTRLNRGAFAAAPAPQPFPSATTKNAQAHQARYHYHPSPASSATEQPSASAQPQHGKHSASSQPQPSPERTAAPTTDKYPGYERARKAASDAAKAKAKAKANLRRRYSDPFAKSGNFSKDTSSGSAEQNAASQSEAKVRAMKIDEIQAMLRQLGLSSETINNKEDLVSQYMKAMYNAGVGPSAANEAQSAYEAMRKQASENLKKAQQGPGGGGSGRSKQNTPKSDQDTERNKRKSTSKSVMFEPHRLHSMSNKELKRFLKSRNVDTAGCVEREEFMMRVLECLSNKELKILLLAKNLNADGCCEKSDYIRIAAEALKLTRPDKPNPSGSPKKCVLTHEMVFKMSVKELRALLRERGADAEGAVEKADLIARALSVLGLAPVPDFSRPSPGPSKGVKRSRQTTKPKEEFDPSSFKLEYMSNKDLMTFLKARRVDTSACVEREDYMRSVLESLTNKELKTILKNRNVDVGGCFERADFLKAARQSFNLDGNQKHLSPTSTRTPEADGSAEEESGKHTDRGRRKGKGLFVNRARVEQGHGEAKVHHRTSSSGSTNAFHPDEKARPPEKEKAEPAQRDYPEEEVRNSKGFHSASQTDKTEKIRKASRGRKDLPELNLRKSSMPRSHSPKARSWRPPMKENMMNHQAQEASHTPKTDTKLPQRSRVPSANTHERGSLSSNLSSEEYFDEVRPEPMRPKNSPGKPSLKTMSETSTARAENIIQGALRSSVSEMSPEVVKQLEKKLADIRPEASKVESPKSSGSYYWRKDSSSFTNDKPRSKGRPGSAFSKLSEAQAEKKNSVLKVHPDSPKINIRVHGNLKSSGKNHFQETEESSLDFTVELPNRTLAGGRIAEANRSFDKEKRHDFSLESSTSFDELSNHEGQKLESSNGEEDDEDEPMDWVPKRPQGIRYDGGDFEDESSSEAPLSGPSDDELSLSSGNSEDALASGRFSVRSDAAISPAELRKHSRMEERQVDPKDLNRKGSSYVKWLRNQVPERKYSQVAQGSNFETVQNEVDFWVNNAHRESELRRLSKGDYVKPHSRGKVKTKADGDTSHLNFDDSGLGSNNKGAWFWGKT